MADWWFGEGQAVAVRALVIGSNGEGGLIVQIDGPRPPFSRMQIVVGEADMYATDIEAPVERPAPLKAGDRVRNDRGVEYEVVADPRATEDGVLLVSLWNEERGFDADHPSNLERVHD